MFLHRDRKVTFCSRAWALIAITVLVGGVAFAQKGSAAPNAAPIRFVTMFSSEKDVSGTRTPCQRLRDVVIPAAAAHDVAGERPAVCDKVLDVALGKADSSLADKPLPLKGARLAVDSRFRVLVTEPETRSVQIFDFAGRKHSRINGDKDDRMSSPYSVAVDARNNIYVSDMVRGRIAVYSAEGKFKQFIGDFHGEGAFERPHSMVIDPASSRIYLADSARNLVLILDLNGKILAKIGKRGGGTGPGEFRDPAEIAIYERELFVLDSRNNRIEVFDLDGHFMREFTFSGTGANDGNGMAFDSQGRLFVPALNWVEVFDREGKMLFRFGQSGEASGEFHMPKAVCTDSKNRVYVLDSGNRRVQVFQITDIPRSSLAASQ